MSPKDAKSVKLKTGADLRAQAEARLSAQAREQTPRAILDGYKEVIRRGQRGFVEMGTALGLVNKQNLYREDGYGSFEAFVVAEFEMPKTTAYRLIEAARVVTQLSQVGTIASTITNQAQALELAPLVRSVKAMASVVETAQARGAVTADLLKAVRIELFPNPKVIEGEVVPDRAQIEAPKSEVVEAMTQAIKDATDASARAGGPAAAQSPSDPTDPGRAPVGQAEQVEQQPEPTSGPVPPSPGDGPDVTPEHQHVEGSTGGPGECSAECACGVTFDGFDTHAEAIACLDQHIADPKSGIDEDVRLGDGAAEPDEVEQYSCEKCGGEIPRDERAVPQARCEKCDPEGVHRRSDLPDGGLGQCELCAATDLETAAMVGEAAPDAPAFTPRQREDAARQLGYLESGALTVTGAVKHFSDVDCDAAEEQDEAPRWASEIGKTTCLDCLRAVVASTDSPVEARTDTTVDSSQADLPSTGGQDSAPATPMAGAAPAGTTPSPDVPVDTGSVATDRPGIDHPRAEVGEAPTTSTSVAGVTPRVDDRGAVDRDEVEGEPAISSSTDPASALMGPVYALMSVLDELDYDVVPQMLLEREWSALDSLAVSYPAAVELLHRWRKRTP